MEGFIQVSYRKVNSEEISYQAIYRETRKETEFHMTPIYLIIDKGFNYDLYIMNIEERIPQ